MGPTLEACKELKDKEPQDHNDDCGPSHHAKRGLLPTGTEYTSVEEECAQLHKGKCVVSEHIQGDLGL